MQVLLLLHTTAGDLQLMPSALVQHTPVANVEQSATGVAVGVVVGVAVGVVVGIAVLVGTPVAVAVPVALDVGVRVSVALAPVGGGVGVLFIAGVTVGEAPEYTVTVTVSVSGVGSVKTVNMRT